jgi:uncharacterized surface protein with fasciclin (FAS1) repeats
MRVSRRAAGIAAGVALAVGATGAAAPSASAHSHHKKLGTKSLVKVLSADKSGFDTNSRDFDILTAAVGAVLKAKPKSAVSVLGKGKVALTAFIPNDGAFRYLVWDLTGKNLNKEADVFAAAATLGIPTLEKVLLYHVVPGATIDAKAASKANQKVLKTAAGLTVKVRVVKGKIYIQDKDSNSKNPQVVLADINKGNRQIAHGINRVLRPLDLPPLAKKH